VQVCRAGQAAARATRTLQAEARVLFLERFVIVGTERVRVARVDHRQPAARIDFAGEHASHSLAAFRAGIEAEHHKTTASACAAAARAAATSISFA
jgi:hypothetical protein